MLFIFSKIITSEQTTIIKVKISEIGVDHINACFDIFGKEPLKEWIDEKDKIMEEWVEVPDS